MTYRQYIWWEHNDILFNGKTVNITEAVDWIKLLSWSWFIWVEGRKKNLYFLYWWLNPLPSEMILNIRSTEMILEIRNKEYSYDDSEDLT